MRVKQFNRRIKKKNSSQLTLKPGLSGFSKNKKNWGLLYIDEWGEIVPREQGQSHTHTNTKTLSRSHKMARFRRRSLELQSKVFLWEHVGAGKYSRKR